MACRVCNASIFYSRMYPIPQMLLASITPSIPPCGYVKKFASAVRVCVRVCVLDLMSQM